MLDLNCVVHRTLRSTPVRALIMVVVGVLSLHDAAPAAFADEWIVDNTSPTVHLNGSWERSTAVLGFYGVDYVVHAPGHGPASVHWPFPSDGTPGQYEVYVRFASAPDRASSAVYHVEASHAAADVSVNQQLGGGAWHGLGTFTFEPGQREELSLSGEADGVVVADAVEWVGPLDADESSDVASVDEGGSGDVADPVSAAPLQSAVNGGDQPWRLDPLAVAHAEAPTLGLSSSDPMRLLEVSEGAAVVRVVHASSTYDIQLSQPAQAGPLGIWVVDSMHRADNSFSRS
jgi:hypothetical protein